MSLILTSKSNSKTREDHFPQYSEYKLTDEEFLVLQHRSSLSVCFGGLVSCVHHNPSYTIIVLCFLRVYSAYLATQQSLYLLDTTGFV